MARMALGRTAGGQHYCSSHLTAVALLLRALPRLAVLVQAVQNCGVVFVLSCCGAMHKPKLLSA